MISRPIMFTFAAGALVALAGCGGSATTESSPAPASAGTESGCQVADASGTTKDPEIQRLATETYESLDCSSSESMNEQLRTAAKEPALTGAVSAAGGTTDITEAAGAVQLLIYKDSAGCTVLAMDSPRSKMLNCI